MRQDLRWGAVVLVCVGGPVLATMHCGSSNSGSFTFDGGTSGDTGGGGGSDGRALPSNDSGRLSNSDARDENTTPVNKCIVSPGGANAPPTVCTQSAPPNSFSPKVKWTWTAPPTTGGGITGSIVTPLVGEFTDTNHDGMVNLCDIPNVIVTTGGGPPSAPGTIYMLAGDTGALTATFDGIVDASVTPAFGDINGDGLPDVVANDVEGHLVAYDHTGHIEWVGADVGAYKNLQNSYCHAIAIYDLDGDGSPEIIEAFQVFDNMGNLKFGIDESAYADQFYCPANTAADLDGDGKLEVIFGNAAYHSDGSVYWTIPGPPGQPQVGNFDTGTEPEIFIARQDGIMLLSHDGTVLFGPTQLYEPGPSPECWSKPAVIADFNGDGHPDIANSSCDKFTTYQIKTDALSASWTQPIDDTSGLASSTAFDFLGRGYVDAVYGDQDSLWVFGGLMGNIELTSPRSSGTLIEYPVVADVDNDGSADIVVVSNQSGDHPENYTNTVSVLEDAQKRWVPTRRIWNQHAYHVTNVNEDGTIPKVMAHSWEQLNTFRTNAQISANGACAPPPPAGPK